MTTKTQEPTERAVAKPETGLVKWEPKTVELLEQYPEQQFNLLVPTMSIRQVNPYLVPDIEIVKLSIDESKGEIYHDNQMKDGHYAPTAKGLSRLRLVAGIDELDSRRTDDGKDPDVVEWTAVIEMQLPSGQRVRAHGSKRVDLGAQSFASEAHKRRTRQFMLENAQTKALNRAIRSILSLHGSMPKAQLAKPFAVLRWVPNMSDPDVRRRMLDNLLPATVAAYGPEPRQIGASHEVIEAEEAPDDEDARYLEVQTNGQATVDASTGEVVAETLAADEPPDWFGEAPTEAQTGLTERLQAVAGANAQATQPATADQRKALQEALRGMSANEAGIVLLHVFDVGQLSAIEQRHAQAILEVGAAIGHERLVAEWKGLAARVEADEAAA